MEFSAWLQKERQVRGLDLSELAQATGIDAATVSRLENGERDVTLLTVVRICEGLRISTEMFLGKLRDEIPSTSDSAHNLDAAVLRLEDVVEFGALLRKNREYGFHVLAKYLNVAVDLFNTSQKSCLISHEARAWLPRPAITPDRLELAGPDAPRGVYDLTINYPEDITTATINALYDAGSAFTIQDVSHYMKMARQTRTENRSTTQANTKISASLIGRIERGELVLIKLKDALAISDALSETNRLFGLFWRAVTFEYNFGNSFHSIATKAHGLSARETYYIEVLMRGFRWIHLYDGGETERAKEFRQDLKGA